MNQTITDAYAMIERLQEEADAFRLTGDKQAAHLLNDAVKVVNGLITLALRGEQDIADAVCDEKPVIQRDALNMAARIFEGYAANLHAYLVEYRLEMGPLQASEVEDSIVMNLDHAAAIRALIPAEAARKELS